MSESDQSPMNPVEKQSDSPDFRVKGWIAPLLVRVVVALSKGGTSLLPDPVIPPGLSACKALELAETRARAVDTFVAVCWSVEVLFLVLLCTLDSNWFRLPMLLLLGWRVVDVVAADLKMSIFDPFMEETTLTGVRPDYVPTTATRVLTLVALNYFELLLAFAGFYVVGSKQLVQSTTSLTWLDGRCGTLERALHMSFMTQLTIGFGDLVPNSWLRLVVWLQGCLGLLMIAIIVTRYMSLVPPKSR